jgi:RHS repeat-associated protein
VAGEETRFLVDKNRDYAQVLEEYTPSKIIKASYIYGQDLISQLRDTERSFYHVDGLGSTRALTDINGLLTDAYVYEAFGKIIKQLGNTQNSYLFAGEQRDPNLSLDYLRARYLNVNSGRFYGRDPFKGIINNPITSNKYTYANSNPTKFVDPSGLFGLASIGVELSIAQTLAEYQINFAIAGLKGIKRTATVVDEVLKPANTLKEIGLSMIGGESDSLGFGLYQIGSQLTGSGYGLIAFIVSGIYFEASASSIKLNIFPRFFRSIQLEISFLSAEITFGGWIQEAVQIGNPNAKFDYDLLDKMLKGYIAAINSFLDAQALSEYLATGNQNPLSSQVDDITGRAEAILKLLGRAAS